MLYGLTVVNLTLLLILVVILGRNVVRFVMERRRGKLGARFRMRLTFVFLLMAVGPSVVLIAVGSNIIQQTIDRWFNVDVERLLSASQSLATSLRETVAERGRRGTRVVAREIGEARVLQQPRERLRALVESRAEELRLDGVSVFTTEGELLSVMNPRLSQLLPQVDPGDPQISAAFTGAATDTSIPLADGEALRSAAPIRGANGEVRAVVLGLTMLPGQVADDAREVEERYAKFRTAESFKTPIKALYLLFYAFAGLLLIFGAVWLSDYLARRITTPIRLVAEGAERITSGERGVRVDFVTADEEFSSFIASFNRMSERLARSEEEVDHTRAGLVRKNEELEERRALMETVFETVGTGVLVIDANGTLASWNAAAGRFLDLHLSMAGRRLDAVLGTRGGIVEMVDRVLSGRVSRQEREIAFPAAGGAVTGVDKQLAMTVVRLTRAPGTPPGALVVLDDLTPLMRAQKVAAWGEVARKLAHEIKNPLTPIQLSAQRIRKAYVKGAPDIEKIIVDSTGAIVSEVEALKTLVDEFAQFARLPTARLKPTAINDVIDETLSLYDGAMGEVALRKRLAPSLPLLRLDPEQIKRVLINLLDNAIAATTGRGTVEISSDVDAAGGVVRVGVADDGPGIAAEDRERLFVPNFSTKKRGSGLGLAIVSRIVQEHQGTIRVEDNLPRGARFVVELPV
jgi:two-component system, NtrC family, nitrogen regulation sensor histidine kinase NtrY